MRKLLYLTVSVALLSAPAAFAQNNSQNSMPPPPPETAPDMSTSPQSAPPPDQSQVSPDTGAVQGNSNVTGQTPGATPGADNQAAPGTMANPGTETSPGSRLYTNTTEVNGQTLQIISNAPVPDTRATRAKYRPLSHAGRRTSPRGN
jgi:hypothetical protein